MQRAARFFLIAAAATLFYRRDVFYLFKIFEFLMLPAVFLTAAAFIFQKAEFSKLKNVLRDHSAWVKIFALMFLFGAVGTINGWRLYGLEGEALNRTIGNFFYLMINGLAFFLVIYYGREKQFKKKLLLTFYSPLIFTPFIFIPEVAYKLGLTVDQIHFYGLHKNPITFAFLAFFTLILMIDSFLTAQYRWKKLLYWFGGVTIFSLIIWTGSRAAWLAVFIVLIWIGIYLFRIHYREFNYKKRVGYLGIFFLLIAFSSLISFAILPKRAQLMALDRFFPQISDRRPEASAFDKKTLGNALSLIIQKPIPSFPYQAREMLWPQSLKLLFQHPFLGLGPEYFRSANAIQQDGDGIYTHSHNTILQAALTGGIGLMTVLFIAVALIFKKLAALKKDNEWLMLSGLMIGSLAFLMIAEFLFIIPWIWLAMALIAAAPPRTHLKSRFRSETQDFQAKTAKREEE